MTLHSPIGASGAHRWMMCPGSVALSMMAPADSSDYAVEGSAAHEIARRCCGESSAARPEDFYGEVYEEGERCAIVDREMVEGVNYYLSILRGIIRERGIEFKDCYVEHQFALSDVHRDAFGTVDFGCVAPPVLDVVDLKYGVGIRVEPEWNPQLMYYAAGMYLSLPLATRKRLERVVLHVVQPRHDHPQGFHRTWELSVQKLLMWVSAELRPAARRAMADGGQTLALGSWCRFCPARMICSKMKDTYMTMDTTVDPNALEDWELGAMLEQAEVLRAFVRTLEDETYQRLSKGRNIPGFKLVEKKTNRVWRDDAEERLRSEFKIPKKDLYETKLRSPAQIEKGHKRGKEAVASLAYKPPAGLTVAPASDKRGAVKPAQPDEVFGCGTDLNLGERYD